MAEEDMIPAFEGLHIGSVSAKARASAKSDRQEKRLDNATARSVGNEMARENRWEGEVNDEIDKEIKRGKIPIEKRDYFLRIFLLAKQLAYEKKKEKKSSEIMSAEEGEKIYEKAKVKAAELIKKEDAATAKREKSASKKGGRKTRKKGKKYTKKSRRGRKHKTRKFRTYF